VWHFTEGTTAQSQPYSRGEKVFEISNQVGNVLLTLSDQKVSFDENSDGIIDRDMSSI
jgi:hypothetical protein